MFLPHVEPPPLNPLEKVHPHVFDTVADFACSVEESLCGVGAEEDAANKCLVERRSPCVFDSLKDGGHGSFGLLVGPEPRSLGLAFDPFFAVAC